MAANEVKRLCWVSLQVSGRVILVLGSEAVAGVILRGLTWSGLDQGKAIILGAESGSERLSLSRLVVAGAACLVWVAFSLLVISTVGTVLLAVLRRYAARVQGLAWLGWLGGPLWCRRVVVCACGLGLTAPIAASASLAVDGVTRHSCAAVTRAQTTPLAALSGLPLPDLPDGSGRAGTKGGPRVVQRGESLWLIAGSELPPTASDAVVGRRVDALYALNRRAIGGDPDLIFPGTMLTQPGGRP